MLIGSRLLDRGRGITRFLRMVLGWVPHPQAHQDRDRLCAFLPSGLAANCDLKSAIPKLAKDPRSVATIRAAVARIPTRHELILGDARSTELAPASLHLVLTSPPYWTLKRYSEGQGQLGHIGDYGEFLAALDAVWRRCFDALVPGGRMICVVGDVCMSRRRNHGRHAVVPLHAAIQERCRAIGYDNLAPIIWNKIGNVAHEVENGSSFLGKPYEPNCVIKNEIEYILMERKPGGYRSPGPSARMLSLISEAEHRSWFRQIWTDIPGSRCASHPASFPTELAYRLIRMFSFVGDTVLDPFAGTGTTAVAAGNCGRNSIGFDVAPEYCQLAFERLRRELAGFPATTHWRGDRGKVLVQSASGALNTVNEYPEDAILAPA